MKKIELNNLNTNQRRLLQLVVIIGLLLFLGYFFIQNKPMPSQEVDDTVYLEDSTLYVFGDTYSFEGYPDKIISHYPYFIFVQGTKSLSFVYNLETKEKVKEVPDILLDYYDGNIIYNEKETYFNNINLGEFCDSAFIKSDDEVLCITKKSDNYADNMLISINPESPNLWKRVYESDNILTTVSVINDKLYLGEINFETRQNYLTIDDRAIPIEAPVNIVYKMRGHPYFASYISEVNKEQYIWCMNKKMIVKNKVDKIYLYHTKDDPVSSCTVL